LIIEDVLEEFISWLPALRPHEAYLALLMIRARELKKRLGRRIRERALMFEAVYGYASEKDPSRGWELWRTLLMNRVMLLDAVKESGLLLNIVRKPGTNEVEAIEPLPREAAYVFVQINPSNALKASGTVARGIVENLAGLASLEERTHEHIRQLLPHPRRLYLGALARHHYTRFHVVDVDSPGLLMRLGDLFSEFFGFKPALITTSRGGHLLVNLELLKEKGLLGKYVGSPPGKWLGQEMVWLRKLAATDMRAAVEQALELPRRGVPFYHFLNILSELTMGEDGSRVVEVKKQGLEPVPGQEYKGVVVLFSPEEF
jgi:hypothetical protein